MKRGASAAFTFGMLFAPAFAWGHEAGLPAGWAAFSDEQAGYEICFPADKMKPRPDLEKDGHRIFQSGDDSIYLQLDVWTQANPDGKGLPQFADEVVRNRLKTRRRVALPWEYGRPHWAGELNSLQMEGNTVVISGRELPFGVPTTKAEGIFHAKVIVEHEKAVVFLFTYVRSTANEGGSNDEAALADRMLGCFRKR